MAEGPETAGPNELVLYFWPGSFYSQKGRYALVEKGIAFRERMVSLEEGDNIKPWYMKINPEGKIPTLQHGDKFIPDSNKIIEYLDATFGAPLLQPNPGTDYGRKVKYFHERLDSIFIEVLTMGTCLYQEMAIDFMIPQHHIDRFKGMVFHGAEKMEQLKEAASPELKEAFEAKRVGLLKLREALKDKSSLLKMMEHVKGILQEVEEQLDKTEKACGKKDHWLCGEDFTVADMILVITLWRTHNIGLSKVYFLGGKLPQVEAYFKRMLKRPSFHKVCMDPRLFQGVDPNKMKAMQQMMQQMMQ